jgi:hypothetical protein
MTNQEEPIEISLEQMMSEYNSINSGETVDLDDLKIEVPGLTSDFSVGAEADVVKTPNQKTPTAYGTLITSLMKRGVIEKADKLQDEDGNDLDLETIDEDTFLAYIQQEVTSTSKKENKEFVALKDVPDYIQKAIEAHSKGANREEVIEAIVKPYIQTGMELAELDIYDSELGSKNAKMLVYHDLLKNVDKDKPEDMEEVRERFELVLSKGENHILDRAKKIKEKIKKDFNEQSSAKIKQTEEQRAQEAEVLKQYEKEAKESLVSYFEQDAPIVKKLTKMMVKKDEDQLYPADKLIKDLRLKDPKKYALLLAFAENWDETLTAVTSKVRNEDKVKVFKKIKDTNIRSSTSSTEIESDENAIDISTIIADYSKKQNN